MFPFHQWQFVFITAQRGLPGRCFVPSLVLKYKHKGVAVASNAYGETTLWLTSVYTEFVLTNHGSGKD